MADNLSGDLKELKDSITRLEARVEQLESEAKRARPDDGEVVRLVSTVDNRELVRDVIEPAAEMNAEKVLSKTPGVETVTGGAGYVREVEAPKAVLTQDSAEPASLPAAAPTAPAAVPTSASLESRIGQIWLNRIGIVSLVIGLAFLLMYSFQYFGAQAKLACGAAISLALIGFGEWTGRKQGTRWFGSGLIGGGWALAYFTAYASHFVQSVQVVGDATMAGVLMLATATGAMVHAVLRRAQEVATLSVVLGYITVALTNVSLVSLVANLGLLLVTCVLAARMKWHRLLLYGTIASYLVVMPHFQNFSGTTAYGVSESAVSIGLLLTYWLTYMISGLLAARGSDGRNQWLIAAGLINAFGFTIGYFTSLGHLVNIGLGQQVDVWKFPATIGVAAVYAGISYFAGRLREHGLSTLYMILGLFTVTVALLLKLDHQTTALYAIWALESGLLAWAGLHYRIPAVRRFAYGLAIVVNLCTVVAMLIACEQTGWKPAQITEMLILPLVAIGCAVGVTWCYRAEQSRIAIEDAAAMREAVALAPAAAPGDDGVIATAAASDTAAAKRSESNKTMLVLGFHSYFMAAAVLCWFFPLQLTSMMREHALPSLLGAHPEHLNVLWWALESAIIVALGIQLRARAVRILGVLGFAATFMAMLVLQPGVVITTVLAGMLFAMAWLYKKHATDLGTSRRAERLWTLAGVAVMTLTVPMALPGNMLAPYWAVEGLALLVAGFRLREKTLRVCGLLAFVMLVGKLLMVDLAAADTLQRIISFIVAGLVLLAASYGYARFSRKLEIAENPENPEVASS